MNARKTEWTIEDIRLFLTQQKGEEVGRSSAATWARRHAQVVDKRQPENGQYLFNVYDPKQVREAYKAMPGQGGPGKPRPSRKKTPE